MIINESPVLCVSRCLGFENCRFNGGMVRDNTIESLRNHVEFITVCPECDIGLPTPREALRIIEKAGSHFLVESKSLYDYTDQLTCFSKEFTDNLGEVDAFIFKSRSPSCGIKDVKIYSNSGGGGPSKKGKGIFAEILSEKFPGYPMEDEGRLSNFNIREAFLTKLFILSEFRFIKREFSMDALLNFHTRNKMLLNSFSIKESREMGRILANHQHYQPGELYRLYEYHLRLALSRSARYTTNINILQHAFGYFSKDISTAEKQFILDSIEKYRKGQLPLSTPLNIVKAYIIRFDIGYLKSQSFFEPYPAELVEMRDSGKLV
ncbi:MAG: DUF523 and DUF1722 domain-containing protein [Bacillota bacterium]|nr:DUF523 and DUF1722 domain-containing protein [Bacillota bacterium]